MFRRSQSGDIIRVLLENYLQHHYESLDLAAAENTGNGSNDNNTSSFVISLWSTLQRTLSFGGGVQEGYFLFPKVFNINL